MNSNDSDSDSTETEAGERKKLVPSRRPEGIGERPGIGSFMQTDGFEFPLVPGTSILLA
jgi:hypothetical protein